MSEPETGRELAATPTPRAVREYRVVENRLGIMDTARFEHLGRVATVMAKAGLMPMSLTHAKPPGAPDNATAQELPYEMIQARAFLIANQADLFGMDPNALAQCTSIVHGKLMYEGKLVHALIAERLGIDLIYEFGLYDVTKRDIKGTLSIDAATGERRWAGEMPTGAEDQALAVRVVGTLPGESQPRWIAGSVGMWHKGAKSPWGASTAWPRQLRYMGAREWCRAYKPSLLLGIMADDEVDEYDMARQVGAMEPAAPQLVHAGFSDVRTAQIEQGPGKPRTARSRAKPPEPADANTALAGDDLPAAAKGPTAEEIATANAALGGDDLPAGLKGDATPQGEPTGSAPAASDAEVSEGHAEPDEVYLMADAPAMEDGRRVTFKNGKSFSTTGKVAGLKVYDEHPPEPAAETETETEQGQDDDEEADLPPDFSIFIKAVKVARDFPAVKAALKTLKGSAFWKGLREDQANLIRKNTWETMTESFTPEALPDPARDLSAFRLWVEVHADADTITTTLSTLENDPDFKGKTDNTKDQIRGAAAARIKALEP